MSAPTTSDYPVRLAARLAETVFGRRGRLLGLGDKPK